MNHIKTVTIDQLKPGMFIVEMDQPWYRTPFLIHKRFIRDTKDIDLLRQHGIRELKIDSSRGLDATPIPSRDAPLAPHTQKEPADIPMSDHAELPTSSKHPPRSAGDTERNSALPQPPHAQKTVSVPQPSLAAQPASLEEPLPPTSRTEVSATQPRRPETQQDIPRQKMREQAAAAQETYNEAIGSMERMFDELEAGVIPQPETSRMVVGQVLSRVLDNPASMLSLLTLQKMKRFDRTLASHALDVCTLSLIVAHDYGVVTEDLEALGAGALLHDIGYTRLPRNLYRRSRDLTEQESTMMQQHPALGQAVLRDAKEDRDTVIRIVVEHHEYSNGKGFPHKLTGDTLSILAQLVGLVDLYDGMVSRRGGRPAMLQHDAIRQLFRLGDSGQYPKDLIQTMIGSLGVYPIGSLVLLNTGEQAVVVGMNPTQRLKPVVSVIAGAQGGCYITPIRVDLGTQAAGMPTRTIAKVLDPLLERVNVAMFLDGIHEEAA
ncbi:MAG: DUF3391 domain-containing protein [Nitrospira sp. CG24E]|nr:MAG: DUF3391 domain-containing protein [Nitrospira sp. CG24E]